MRDSTICSNRSNRSSSAESDDSTRTGRGVRPGFGSGAGAALNIIGTCGIRGSDGKAPAAGAAGISGVGGTGATTDCELTALEWPVFHFGPEPTSAGLGVADGAASPEKAPLASVEKLTAAEATSGVPGTGSLMRAP